ncbi:MAG: hypothetical protein ACRCV6_07965 [Formosimonas sp.]
MTHLLGSRVFRVMFGLIFVYTGINLAGDLVRDKTGANSALKALVHKYDAADIVESLVSTVGNAVADSFDKNGQPTTLKGANQQAKAVSAGLETQFRKQLPAAFEAVDDITKAIVLPIQDAIRTTAANSRAKK